MRAEICKGNRKIANVLPQYDNQCIGAFYDELKQRVFYFNCNSYIFHGIYMYDIELDTISKVLLNYTDSQEDLFDFDADYPIASVNILYRTEEDGDILIWTDRNNRPMGVNIKDALAEYYGDDWKASYLTIAKPMPLIPPVCSYEDDATITLNNFRKKLYQFRYRWIYRNLEKSTWSPYSKIPAPLNPDDLATDINQQKNNRIDIEIQTGDADVIKVEISARECIGSTFSDEFLIKTLDKDDDGLQDNSTYLYEFFNDASFPLIDATEAALLFDYVPKKANTQELLNGNVIIYGGITEGYDFDETLSVTVATELVDESTDALTVGSYSRLEPVGPSDYEIYLYTYFTGTPVTGDVVTLTFAYPSLSPDVTFSYTVLPGDGYPEIAQGLLDAYNALPPVSPPLTAQIDPSNSGGLEFYSADELWQGGSGSVVYASSSTPIVDDGISIACYRPMSKYRFGLVYFDEFGVTNGVVTNDDMIVETLEVNTTGATQPDITAITIDINHRPPIWAKNFAIVRTANLTVSFNQFLVTKATAKDAEFGYMDITNLQENTNNIPSYTFREGDRVRIIGDHSGAFSAAYDFPIVSVVEDPTVGASAKTGTWIKVPYNAVITDFGTNQDYWIEVYTPAANTDDNQLVYYEFGENYEVGNPGESDRYHKGKIQDQISGSPGQPAIFSLLRGDFYLRPRTISQDAGGGSWTNQTYYIIDMSVSDKYPSKVTGNGRPFVVDEYAKEAYYSTLIRYSLAYQQNTSINQTNRFYSSNFAEVDRSRGDIQRFKLRGQMLRVFQSVGTGVIPVYQQIISTTDASNQLVRSDEIINRIQYYIGNFGMGDQFCGLASSSSADYFTDPVHGYQVRAANDGLTPISELYKGQFYISDLLTPYAKTWYRTDGTEAKVIGCFDFLEEEFITHLQYGNNASTLDASFVFDNHVDVIFTGTPANGDVIVITVGAAGTTETFTYTVGSITTIPELIVALVSEIEAQSSFFSAAIVASSILRIDASADITECTVTITSPEIENYTFTFNEKRNAYSSFFDYFPEWMCNAQDKILSWVDGELWVHDNEAADSYSQFYGTEYNPSITLVFNEQEMVRKKFLSLGYQANRYWVAPTTGDITTSMTNPQTGFAQESQLKSVDFELTENVRVAAFLFDANSRSTAAEGLNNGDYLGGQWLEVTLTYQGNDYAWIYAPYINYSISNRTV